MINLDIYKSSPPKKLSTLPQIKRVRLLDCYFDRITEKDAVDWSIELIHSGRKAYICTVNVAILMMMRSHSHLIRFIDGASLIVADGQPIIWLSKLLKCGLPERVTGIDLIEAIVARAEQEGFGVYLLGSTPELIQRSAEALLAKHPNLKLHFSDGYFPLEHSQKEVEKINNSGASILFVGMGVPRQDIFLGRNLPKLNVNLAMGVGGSFDVIAGLRTRAPLWMQRYGLEWLYRLVQEPKRLGKRYVITNSQFLIKAAKAVLKSWFSNLFSPIAPAKRGN